MHRCSHLRNYCRVYGDSNSINIVIFGPVTPVWSGGEFCTSLIDLLVGEGYRLFVVDSLHFLQKKILDENQERVMQEISSEIKNNLPEISIVAGYALGGTIAMKIAKYMTNVPRLLCISAPGYVDSPLKVKLEHLVGQLRRGELKNCLELLSLYVAPEGAQPKIEHIDKLPSGEAKNDACFRMLKGFEFLLKLDARENVQIYDGKILCILGENSQLATVENQAASISPESKNHKLALIPKAGMRVMQDNPAFTLSTISDWLSDEK